MGALNVNTALLRQILVGFVRDEVYKVGLKKGVLGLSGGIDSNDIPLVATPPGPIVDRNTAARDYYELASEINVVSAWDSFIRIYPSGFYSDLAKVQRDKLIAAKAAATEQAKTATEKTMDRPPRA